MDRPDNQKGFTLIEMLVALMILTFGLTAVAGSLMMGVSTRRGSEMRFKAVHMVDHVFRYLQEDYFVAHDTDSGPLPAIGTVSPSQANGAQGSGAQSSGVAKQEHSSPVELPGYPGMKFTVTFIEDPDYAEVVLARVRISWKEQGEQIAESFERVMIREKPFSHRISQIRGSK